MRTLTRNAASETYKPDSCWDTRLKYTKQT